LTHRCLESVLRTTHADFELIVIDDGSTDDTSAMLEEFARSASTRNASLRDVRILRNEASRGFSHACMQGLREARGEFLMLLDGDTILSQNSLASMIDWSLVDPEQIGLVGPVSDQTPPPQQVELDFSDLTTFEEFAAERRRKFVDAGHVVQRLANFCLLMRRETLARLELLDERLECGFFEHDDWCMRVRRRGLRLLLAQNVLVHRVGSRASRVLPIEPIEVVQEKFEKGHDKQDESAIARHERGKIREPSSVVGSPPTFPAPAEPTPRPKVSLCMIVRNEEANLPACLESVAGLFHETIIVDTGSTDATKEIAAGSGARVFDFPWIDNFAAARNASLRHARGEWIFWMDADDRIDVPNRTKLERLLGELSPSVFGYVMKCLCLADPETAAATVVDHVRLFRNHPEVRWKYRIHEQILPSIRKQRGETAWADVVIHHTGYQDNALRERKRNRDLRLLRLEDQENPDDPFTLFNLGNVYLETGQQDLGLDCLRRSLVLSHPTDSIVRKLYALIAQVSRQRGRVEEAAQTCRNGRMHCPDDPELLFQEALCHQAQGHPAEAESCYRQLLKLPPARFFASTDVGIRGHKTLHNLGILCRDRGAHAEAIGCFEQALAASPRFLPGLVALADVHLLERRWIEFEQLLDRIREVQPNGLDADVLAARGHLARREFDQGRMLLEAVSARQPEALVPRIILCHVLLQEGKDQAAAEAALRKVLELAPDHAESSRNLALLRKQGF
jgi:glycosyltransferase involved in cell wall biosynthesis/tetratricopeptide (TPR) repeat protein